MKKEGYDTSTGFMRQQMQLFRKGYIIYVASNSVAKRIEKRIREEQLDFIKTTICDSSKGTSQYSYQVKKRRDE